MSQILKDEAITVERTEVMSDSNIEEVVTAHEILASSNTSGEGNQNEKQENDKKLEKVPLENEAITEIENLALHEHKVTDFISTMEVLIEDIACDATKESINSPQKPSATQANIVDRHDKEAWSAVPENKDSSESIVDEDNITSSSKPSSNYENIENEDKDITCAITKNSPEFIFKKENIIFSTKPSSKIEYIENDDIVKDISCVATKDSSESSFKEDTIIFSTKPSSKIENEDIVKDISCVATEDSSESIIEENNITTSSQPSSINENIENEDEVEDIVCFGTKDSSESIFKEDNTLSSTKPSSNNENIANEDKIKDIICVNTKDSAESITEENNITASSQLSSNIENIENEHKVQDIPPFATKEIIDSPLKTSPKQKIIEENPDKETLSETTIREDGTISPSKCSSKVENKENEVKVIDASSPPAKDSSETRTSPDKSSSKDEYADHLTYTEDGSAIYTDPQTNYQYKWCTTENNWIPCDANSSTTTNPYENEHYKWCRETEKWIPKNTQVTETEYYKWDAEKNEWIAKVKDCSTSEITNPAEVKHEIDKEGHRTYTDKDGTVFFWDVEKNAWFPKIDDDFMARYQMSYGFIDNTSASLREKEELELKNKLLKEQELERLVEEAKANDEAAIDKKGLKRKAQQEPSKWFDIDPAQNTKVYVTNLPLDITLDEFADVMGKCGMIMRDPQTQKYKLKLYTEADGQVKGDGLCDYIKVESVDLALKILDEYELRGHKIRVQRAKFQMRGEYNPALKPKRKKKDKEKLAKIKEKLFDWRPEKMRGERSKNEKTVIIKNLFHPELFEKEVQLILDYQNDLREECGKCGTVRKVVVYDRHSEGVAQINMSSPEEADLVIQMMHGRYFGKRQLTAEHWDGKTKYKVEETEEDIKKRLNKWDQYLETEENKKTDLPKPDQIGDNKNLDLQKSEEGSAEHDNSDLQNLEQRSEENENLDLQRDEQDIEKTIKF